MTASRDLVNAAVRLAADAAEHRSATLHERTFVKKSLIEDLRSALDRLGYGDDWRTLHQVVREEERQPTGATR